MAAEWRQPSTSVNVARSPSVRRGRQNCLQEKFHPANQFQHIKHLLYLYIPYICISRHHLFQQPYYSSWQRFAGLCITCLPFLVPPVQHPAGPVPMEQYLGESFSLGSVIMCFFTYRSRTIRGENRSSLPETPRCWQFSASFCSTSLNSHDYKASP